MRCRSFERDVGEWLRGRLSEKEASAMQSHAETCRRCAETLRVERALRKQAARLPVPGLQRDLWPELATRIQSPAAERPRARLRGLRLAAVAASLAVVGAIAYLAAGRLQPHTMAQMEDEMRVVRLMAEASPAVVSEQDNGIYDLQQRRQAQRLVLVGYLEP